MKFNPKVLLATGATAIALTILPMAAHADQLDGRPGRLAEAIEELNLTTEQESQLAQIRQARLTQMQAIIPEEKRQAFKDALESGQTFREAMAALDLSEAQKMELKELRKSTRDQIKGVLTEEQRNTLRETLGQRRGPGRQGRRAQ